MVRLIVLTNGGIIVNGEGVNGVQTWRAASLQNDGYRPQVTSHRSQVTDKAIHRCRRVAQRASAVLFFIILPFLCSAQGFEISGQSSLTGTFSLTIFDGDSTTHVLSAECNKGLFLFTGQVGRPVAAMLEHPAMKRPLYFFVENSEISISVNASNPDASLIKGSRSNSEYRYLMELYRSDDDPNAFLRQYVKKNPESIYIPLVLHRQMSNLDDATLRQLVTQVSGPACHTYHYNVLRRWMQLTPAVAEGCEMPDFAFLDSQKQRHQFSDSRNGEGATLIFFSASWCDICKTQLDEATNLLANKNAEILVINIDDNPNGWDAHYLKELSVNHLPYMILVDPNGLVQARDIRIWELKKTIRK